MYATFQGRLARGVLNEEIATYFETLGPVALGSPYDAGHAPWVYAWGRGYAQTFEGGSHRTLMIMSSDLGTFEVNDVHRLRAFYLGDGAVDTYGYPTSNEYATCMAERGVSGPRVARLGEGPRCDPDCWRQDFENGTYITWDPANGVVGHRSHMIDGS